MKVRTPAEILNYAVDAGTKKIKRKIPSLLILAFLAGVFVAFAAGISNMAAFNLLAKPETYGIGRFLAGVIFPAGLMMIILTGGELFTGNMLIITPVLERKVTVRSMLLNWLLVFIGNFTGGVFIAWMMYASGLFDSGAGLLGGVTISIAAGKTSLSFLPALLLGIMCNWLVCLAVWSSYAARDAVGKILIIFFVILLFVVSGFEHSIANMYYIPAGIFAKNNAQWLAASNVSAQQLAGLNWANFFIKNLLPVTIGNIIGGAGMVGCLYRLAFKHK